jgi:predicted metal-dependent hydrolase
MTAIAARVPKVDWSQGFDRHWNGGDPAVSHAFNALSFLFPQAERFFIQVAREVASRLDTTNDRALEEAVQGFIAQESCHSHQHNQYNGVLERQGFENVVQ